MVSPPTVVSEGHSFPRRALCSDLVYVILFPQLLCVVHFPDWCNTYGSLFSYCLGLGIRVTGGESLVGLPPLIHFPGFQEPTQEEVRPQLATFGAQIVKRFSF